VLFVGLGFTLALSLFAIFLISQMKAAVRKSLEIHQTGQVSAFAQQIDHGIAQRMDAIQAVGKLFMELGPMDGPQAEAFLRDRRTLTTFFPHSVMVLTPQGRILAEVTNGMRGRRGIDLSYREYFKNAVSNRELVISSPLASSVDQAPIVTLSLPIFDPSRVLRAVLVAALDIRKDPLFFIVSSNRIGSTGYYYLCNRERRFVFHPDPTRINTAIPARGVNLMLDRAMDGQDGSGETRNSLGQAQYLAFKSLHRAPWILCGANPLAEAYASVAFIRNALMGAIIAILFLTLVLFMILGLRLRSDERKLEGFEAESRQHLEIMRRAESVARMGTLMVPNQTEGATGGRGAKDYLSEGLRKILGIDPKEILSEEFMGLLFDPPALAKLGENSGRAKEDGQPRKFELDARRRDGALLRLSFLLWREGSGPQASLMGLVNDVTEHHRSETLLEEYRMLFHLAVDAFAILLPDGTLEQVNPALAALAGRTPDQIKGRSLLEMLNPEDLELARRCLTQASGQGTFITDLRLRMKPRGGGERVLSLNLAPDCAAGKIYAVARDMTALEESLTRVARQARFLEAMEATARLGLWEWDHASGRFHASGGLRVLFGLNAESAFDREDFFARFDPGGQERLRGIFSDGSNSGGGELELPAATLEGESLWLRLFHRTERRQGEPGSTLCVVQESTAVRRAHRITEENETRFRELFTRLSAGFALHAMNYGADGQPSDFRYLLVNPAYESMVGMGAERLLASSASALFPELDRSLLEGYSAVVRTGKPLSFVHFQKTTGRQFRVDAFRAREGQFATLFYDITDQIREENAHRLSQQRLSIILHSIQAVVYESDPRQNMRWISLQAQRLFGYPLESWMQAGFWAEKLDPQDRERVLGESERGVDSRLPFSLEYRFIHAQGAKIWIRQNVTPVEENGRLEGLRGVMVDITETKKVAIAHQENEARSREYLQLVQVLIVALDPQGRILMANRRAAELLGVSEEKLPGMDWYESFVPEGFRETMREMHRSVVEGRITLFSTFESEVQSVDGTVFIIAWRFTLTQDREGRSTGTLHAGIDVTDERAIEAARLELSRALELELGVRTRKMERARQLQRRLNLNSLPLLPLVDLHAAYLPADEVSGDFVRVFPLSGARLAILLADCTGHGIEASMMAVMLHTLCESFVPSLDGTGDPAAYLARLNQRLCELDMEDQFPVMTVVVVHSVSGKVVYAHANGEPMMILGKPGGEGPALLPRARGMHLGFDPATVFESRSAVLQEGETLLVYSDALTELLEKNPLPEQRLGRIFQAIRDPRPVATVHALLTECVSGGKVHDDLTLVACRRAPVWERRWRGGEKPPLAEVRDALRDRGWADGEVARFEVDLLAGEFLLAQPQTAIDVRIDCSRASADWRGAGAPSELPANWERGNPPSSASLDRSRRAPSIESIALGA
jgi:PAS domain S-box-containing protein